MRLRLGGLDRLHGVCRAPSCPWLGCTCLAALKLWDAGGPTPAAPCPPACALDRIGHAHLTLVEMPTSVLMRCCSQCQPAAGGGRAAPASSQRTVSRSRGLRGRPRSGTGCSACGRQDHLDLRREDVDAADDEHVVARPTICRCAGTLRAVAARGASGRGAVADHRQRLDLVSVNTSRPPGAVGSTAPVSGSMISGRSGLPDHRAVLASTHLAGHARAHHSDRP